MGGIVICKDIPGASGVGATDEPGDQKEAKALIELRCDRGAKIARELEFPDHTSAAIRCLDEHWDGLGHPRGLSGEQIPMLARVLSLAQTAEVFITERGLDAALEMTRERTGTWFDPDLVEVFQSIKDDADFWKAFHHDDAAHQTAGFEPQDRPLVADEARLDLIAEGFSQVIDAKSPWTYRHSEGVAKISASIAGVMGFSPQEVRYIRRAALVHDVGKLGISNLILDKPGKLTPEEMTEMRRHTIYTHDILSRVSGFRNLADRGVASRATRRQRIPSRAKGPGPEHAIAHSRRRRHLRSADGEAAVSHGSDGRGSDDDLEAKAGTGICPAVYEALQTYVARESYTPAKIAA